VTIRANDIAARWFEAQGWKPFQFQRDVWQAVRQGVSGLLHATTGSGKTYAVWMAALNCYARLAKAAHPAVPATGRPVRRRAAAAPGLTVLWITPMRALAADTERALNAPLAAMGITWTVGVRTGDTSSAQRAQQAQRLPTALITTPESLSLMLTRPDADDLFVDLRMVVVDEWHELIGNKRGVQLQLALARLRRWRPGLVVWGLSATLGNLPYALEVLVPQGGGRLVQGKMAKELVIDTLLPPGLERFPWAGHLGLRMLPLVAARRWCSPIRGRNASCGSRPCSMPGPIGRD
jgi:ATP-dependent Lhr-like helicase